MAAYPPAGGTGILSRVTVVIERPRLQRRVMGTLIGTQILGGIGLSAGIAIGSLLAEDVSGSTAFAGLGLTFQILGGALIAIPMAAIMGRRGRRPGLVFGYGLAFVGAVLLIGSALARNFPLLLVGSILFGGAQAANSQCRYAAADLSEPSHRGRDLSIVVWATTIGSTIGPNLLGPSEPFSRLVGIPRLAGPFAFSLIGFVFAIALLLWRLRPDPLIVARELAARDVVDGAPGAMVPAHGSVWRGLRVTVALPGALLGLIALALGHATMVAVMVMTPLYMLHGDAGLELIGLVISIHVVGMYALSPLVGLAVDRWSGRTVAFVGAVILVVATVMAGTAPGGHSLHLTIALFLLGAGWSCTFVSGSTMLTNAIPVAERAGVQGASDLVMGLAGAGAGALSGVVVELWGFSALSFGTLGLVVALIVAIGVIRPRPAAITAVQHDGSGRAG